MVANESGGEMANWTSNRYTPVTVDGDWADNTTRALQFGLGGLVVDGDFGDKTVKKLQQLLGFTGSDVDGKFGYNTARYFQAYLGMSPAQQDGAFGPASTDVLQEALNAGTLGASKGTPAPITPSYRGRQSIAVGAVTYNKYFGGGNIQSWIEGALNALGWPVTNGWLNGYETLCSRESSDQPNAVNNWDSNATGPIVGDGNHLNDSRGEAQCIPATFAYYHAANTSNEIYDPVANIAASMLYVVARYGVRTDGSNLAANVQQADPNRPPRGY